MQKINNHKFSEHLAVRKFLDQVNERGLSYCHFKSNLHVNAGIQGATDLDILISRSDYRSAYTALVDANFKLFRAAPPAGYPAVEDWIGFDEESGELAHVHLHWQLTLGEPNLKGYRIPWESTILNNRMWNENSKIYTSSPEMELLLLLTRSALKFRFRSIIRKVVFHTSLWGKELEKERIWLLEKIEHVSFRNLVADTLPPQITTLVTKKLTVERIRLWDFHIFRIQLKRHLKMWKTYNPLLAHFIRWQREYKTKVEIKLLKSLGYLRASRRSPNTGGIIVAIIGSDGSGKSTQVKALCTWLDWKVDVATAYFGSGDGKISWHRAILRFFYRSFGALIRKSCKDNVKKNSISTLSTKEGSAIFKLFFAIYAVSLAQEKRGTIQKLVRARNKGMIIICDRYPQNQILGYNDGPLLQKWGDKRLIWRLFARIEKKLLSVFSEVEPDLVLKLNVSKNTAKERKPETPIEMINNKIEAVKKLQFSSSCKIELIDANQEIDRVQMSLRNAVWKHI